MTEKGRNGSVLIVGGGIAGMQASLDLADAGFSVYLVEQQPAIGGRMVQLDKTFPTNDCSMCTISPRLVQIGLHPNIHVLTDSSVLEINESTQNLRATIRRAPRFVDISKCTACGECEEVCPVSVENGFDTGLSTRKAIFKLYPQATPNAYAIQKKGSAPCKHACPAHVNTQGYVALIRTGRFKEALALIRRDLPLPSICGRACPRPCETACAEGHPTDGAVAIRALKRFVADLQTNYEKVDTPPFRENPNPKHIGIIGSGPAGLSAAYFLSLMGHRVTIFEALPKPGGMLRYGVPAYRLPRDVLDAEIETILSLGVSLETNVSIGRDIKLKSLLEDSDFDALFLAAGRHKGKKLDVPGASLPGVLQGVELLRRIGLGDQPTVGRRVVVVGGGNVAIDVARSAFRLGAKHVTIVYRRQREDMPAHEEEIEAAIEEGIIIDTGFVPDAIASSGDALRMTLKACVACFDASGRFSPTFDEDRTKTIDADTIVLAIGQSASTEILKEIESVGGELTPDPITLQTSVPKLFAGGDLVSGPRTIIEAVAMGRRAAESMDAVFSGTRLSPDWPYLLPKADSPAPLDSNPRHEEAKLAPEVRKTDFREVVLSLSEEDAISEAERCLSCADCSDCRQCESVCQSGAINHDDREQIYDLDVGAAILAPGFDQFDVRRIGEYGFGRYKNVVTSLSLERMLSASGPTEGHIERPSDGKEPRRVAWIQCVGSRDERRSRHYCSAICCMFATKQSTIIKDHFPEIETTIFYMDMRAYGKGFDAYVERAESQFGVQYSRAMISKVYELPDSGDLEITYRKESGEPVTEVFEMVILSSGLTPSDSVKALAAGAGIELNDFGFAARNLTAPNRTNKSRIYVAGVIEGPKDIPETVMSASSAAALAAADVSALRGVGATEKNYPEERDITGESPRVGVFVCRCGTNIARVVDVPTLTEYSRGIGGVVHAEENLYTCSADTQRHIAEKIVEHRLNRVVVASCTPRTHEPLFQETLRNAGLNKYLFEMANIRDQCAWVHADNIDRANEKARDLVGMAVGRAKHLAPLEERRIPVTHTALVVGGGVSGLTAAMALAGQGFESVVVEKSSSLGGNITELTALEDGSDADLMIQPLISQVRRQDEIRVLTDADLVETGGYIGNFTSRIKTDTETLSIEHGVTIIATGARPYAPAGEFGYGTDARIITQSALERRLGANEIVGLKHIAMIQCVGSREGSPPVCSRVCCTQAIKNALRIKALSPQTEVTVFYRDIRTYGLRETLYRDARRQGVLFVRYE